MTTVTAPWGAPASRLQDALAIVAAQDPDRARDANGVGFSQADTTTGNALVRTPLELWDDMTCRVAAELVIRYQGQIGADEDLLALARSLTALPETVAHAYARAEVRETGRAASTAQDATLSVEGDRIVVCLPHYNAQIVGALRSIKGRKFDGKRQANTFPLAAQQEVAKALAPYGVDLTPLLAFEVTEAPVVDYFDVILNGKVVEIRFDYNKATVDAVKAIHGSKFSRDPDPHWAAPVAQAHRVAAFAATYGLTVSDEVVAVAEEAVQAARRALEGSTATTTDIDIPGLPEGLQDHQKAAVAYLLDKRQSFLGDDMGKGKTATAIATVLVANAFPCVVVVPNNAKVNWPHELARWARGLSVHVLSGKASQALPEADFYLVNYDILHPRRGDLIERAPHGLILDESHYIKNKGRKRTTAAQEISNALPDDGVRLALTGTPVTNYAGDLVTQLQAIHRLDDFGGEFKFKNRYCHVEEIVVPTRRGREIKRKYSGARNTAELHERLRETCLVRRKSDTPYPVVDVDLDIDPDERATYEEIEADVVAHLQEIAYGTTLAEGGTERQAEDAAIEAALKAERAQVLVELTTLRTAAADAKIGPAITWISDFISQGESGGPGTKLIVFATHIDLVERLHDTFVNRGVGVVKVRGGVSNAERAEAVERFQNDPDCLLFIGNLESAAEAITLTAAHHVAFLEFAWTPAKHDQAVARAHMRVNDPHPATAYFLRAADTVDETMLGIVNAKRRIVDAITDGVEIDDDDEAAWVELAAELAQRNERS